MKKKLLAASVAAAFSVMAAPASAAWKVNPDGIGHINIIPYYSVQNGNDTHVSITNTDQVNGKVVKVRFRGAEWSDDAFDFTLFLSAGDVWTGVFTQTTDQEGNPVGGLTTYDKSCTLPLTVLGETVPFPAVRLDSGKKDGTLEGYVEIITEGEIPPTLLGGDDEGKENPLYQAIKHTAANDYVPPCRLSGDKNKEALLEALVTDAPWVWAIAGSGTNKGEIKSVAVNSNITYTNVGYTNATTGGVQGDKIVTQKSGVDQFGKDLSSTVDDWIVNATGSLTSYVSIINVQNSKVVTVPATAIVNENAGIRTVKRFFRQHGGANESETVSSVLAGNFSLGDLTADRIFADRVSHYGTSLPLYEFDLPDLTTPYRVDELAGFWKPHIAPALHPSGHDDYPLAQDGHAAFEVRDQLASELAADSVITEYVTDNALKGQTDVVIAQPLRRFFYQYHGVDVTPVVGTPFHRVYAWTSGEEGAYVFGDADTAYEPLLGASNAIAVGPAVDWGREEERNVAAPGGSVWSPGLPGTVTKAGLKGEVTVVAINPHNNVTAQGTDALGALLTVYGVSFKNRDGWAQFSTTTTGTAPRVGTTGSILSTRGFTVDSAGTKRPNGPLPVIGFTAISLYNGSVGAAGTYYGQFIPLKVVK
jgi:hypothetical protein